MSLIYFLKDYPFRLKRVISHFFLLPFNKTIYKKLPSSGSTEWAADLFFYTLDILAVPELHSLANRLIKWNMRPLTKAEIIIGKSIFNNSINFDLVRIDDNAKFGTKKIALAYVSFNTINYRNKIREEIFIHELMHIWQYQHFGSIYIARAIKAQRSKEGYDYGGVANLYKTMLRGGSLLDFNFEQQADIVEDYYKILKNPDLAGPMVRNIYEYFITELYVSNA